MKYIIFSLFLLGCSSRINYNKVLYKAEVEIVNTNETKDTLSIIYFDYLYLDTQDHTLYKKNGDIVKTKVKKYKILEKVQTKL
jgi:hypothetical protein